MSLAAKKTVQVNLRPEQFDALQSLAAKQGLSVAELIRQGVDRLLAETPIEDDPLWNVVALGSSELGDLAVEHDQYLTKDASNMPNG